MELRLSSSGLAALKGLFEGPQIVVLVEWADELGLWVSLGRKATTRSVALIRWDHFETVIMDVVFKEPKEPGVIGFSTWKTSKQS